MTDRLSIRIASFALAIVVNVALAVGIDSGAQARHVGGHSMSSAAASMQHG